jgi:hypothetical protein
MSLYSQLDEPRAEIRLVKITSPSAEDDMELIQCTLIICSLRYLRARYLAIS